MSIIAVPSSGLQVAHEVEDLRLDGDVERGGRLVGDEQLRVAGERHRDHHPLAHAAGQLVRIGVGARLGRRDAHRAQHLDRALARLAAPPIARCRRRPSAIWSPTVNTGLSDVIGSWKIMAMRVAADRRASRPRPASGGPSLPNRISPPAGYARRRGHEAHDRERGHALAAAGLADDAEGAPGPDLEADPVDGPVQPALGAEEGLEVAHLEDRRRLRCRSRCASTLDDLADGPGSARPHDRQATGKV